MLCYNSCVKTVGQRTGCPKGRFARSGQAMLEYVIVFVLLLGLLAALFHCFHAATRVSRRSAALVSSENA